MLYLCTDRTRHASRRPANQGGAFLKLGNALIPQKDKTPVSMRRLPMSSAAADNGEVLFAALLSI